MISFTRGEREIADSEYGFLQGVAELLGVHQADFEKLFDSHVEKIVPKSQADRILQFHRLVLLMNVDSKQEMREVRKIHNIGLGMGLPPSAIDQVLVLMHRYPDKIVPPDVLFNIFKAHYN